jgi:hypothetical protein
LIHKVYVMKRALMIALILVIALTLLVVACSSGETETGTDEADVAIQESGDETTSSSEESTTDEVSHEGGGSFYEDVPVYPGAQFKGEGGAAAFSGTRAEGTVEGASYFTSDSLDTVVSWYREQLSGAKEIAGTVSGTDGQASGVVFLLLSGEGLGAAVTVSTVEGGYGTWITMGEWQGTRVKMGD